MLLSESMQDTFQNRLEKFEQEVKYFQKQYNQLAMLRLLVFVLGIVGSIYLFSQGYGTWLSTGVALISIIAFLIIVKRHQKVVYQKNHSKFLAQINQQEVNRFHHHFEGIDGGTQFQNPAHFYASDLDIFGRSSIFQLLNRTVTPSGLERLANWLQIPATPEVLINRQEAQKELVQKLDWRQEFQARGMHRVFSESDVQQFKEWTEEEVLFNNKLIFKIAVWLAPILTVIAVFLAFQVSFAFIFLPLVVNGILILPAVKSIQGIFDKVYHIGSILFTYSQLLKTFEEEKFENQHLKNLQNQLSENNKSFSEQLKRLSTYTNYAVQRQNAFSVMGNAFLLTDLRMILQLEKWKMQYGISSPIWFEIISELEALNSLTGFHQANPDFHFPTFSSADFLLSVKNIGHPLIPAEKRVVNDFELQGLGQTTLITGSNMSGKTTFERSLGVNIVLAQAGAAVVASEMQVSPMQVFTSMRTQDSLEENLSSFYAELQRIKKLIDHLNQNPDLPVFYLLDEILKGTNSQDRHRGAKSLIFQLEKLRASGLVSTHDLELGALEEQYPFIQNYSFNSTMENGEIVFNYQLEKGVCHSFNASQLMSKIGIKMID